MCTTPLTVSRKYAGKISFSVVPCGKCHECIAKKQAQFAALAVLEAKRSKSMYMVTFTYKNGACPVMFSQDTIDGLNTRFVHTLEFNRVRSSMTLTRKSATGRTVEYLGLYEPSLDQRYVPSLDRDGMRLFLKKVRVQYKRVFGQKLDFRYAAFGEYGDSYHRPHFHFLFFDLEPSQVRFICDYWCKQYGFADSREVPFLNPDGSPARVKVAKYVSKYVSKMKTDYEPLLRGWCEAPRRFSSLRFGLGVLDPEKLKSFTYAKT